jgi:hypothetical protein
MAAAAGGRSGGKESAKQAAALDDVRTQRAVEAGAEKAGPAKAKGAPAGSGDSPKRQGDKLERARDAAAGRGKGR